MVLTECLKIYRKSVLHLLKYTANLLSYLICLRHLFRYRAVTNMILFLKKDLFSITRAHGVLRYHLIYTINMPFLFLIQRLTKQLAAYFLSPYFKITVQKWRLFCQTTNRTPL